jgi:hypothetical protein
MIELDIKALAECERNAYIARDIEKAELYAELIEQVTEAEKRDDEIEALKDRVNALEQLLEDIGMIVRKKGF